MSRLGIRPIKKPNLVGAFSKSDVVDTSAKKETATEQNKTKQVAGVAETKGAPIASGKANLAEVQTKQDKTEQNNAKPNKTEQSDTLEGSATEQNQTKLNTTLNKELHKTKQNKTEQVSQLKTADQMILSLSGGRKKVVSVIYDFCLQKNEDEVETTYKNWSDLAQISQSSIKTTVRHLKLDGYFEIGAPKGGRGAVIAVKVSKDLLISYSKNQTKLNKKLNNTLNKSPSNSSNVLTSLPLLHTIEVPEILKTVISKQEITSLLEKNVIGEDDLKVSLQHFAYDTEHGLVKSKTGPLNLFFGLMRSGQRYKSLKMIELENKEMADYQIGLLKLEEENKKLLQAKFRVKWLEFKSKNPSFLDEIRASNPEFYDNDHYLDMAGFDKFIKLQN